MLLGFELKDAPVPECNNTALKSLSRIVSKKLMMESFKLRPRPCETMKMVVIPELKQLDEEKKFRIQVTFPVEYTEIRHDKVRHRKKVFNTNNIIAGIYLGESVGQCWWVYWLLPGNISHADTSDIHGSLQDLLC